MMMSTPPKPPRVIDCEDIREVYSDKLVAASFAGGGLVITLGCSRVVLERAEQPPTEARPQAVVVNNRIAMSPQLAVDLVNGLTQLINAANNAAQQAQAAAAAKAVGTQAAAPAAGATAPTTTKQ
jgi:hypothetical protein